MRTKMRPSPDGGTARTHGLQRRRPMGKACSLAYIVDATTRQLDEHRRELETDLRHGRTVDEQVTWSRAYHAARGLPFDEDDARATAIAGRNAQAERLRAAERRAAEAATRWEARRRATHRRTASACRPRRRVIARALRGGGRPAGRTARRQAKAPGGGGDGDPAPASTHQPGALASAQTPPLAPSRPPRSRPHSRTGATA